MVNAGAGDSEALFSMSYLEAFSSKSSANHLSDRRWAEGKGELATCRHRVDSGREPGNMCAAIVYMAEYEYD